MKGKIFRIIASVALVAILALAYVATSSDTAYAGKPDGKGGGKTHEKGGPNLFWD